MVSDKVKGLIETVMFWASIATLVLWALGKSFGIIHSPNWMEMVPYFTIAIAVSSASTKVGRTIERIDHMDKEVNSLRTAVIAIGKDVREIQRKAFCLNDMRCPSKR